MQEQPIPAAFIRATYLWIGPLILGAGIFLIATPLLLIAHYPQLLSIPLLALAGFGGLALLVRSFAREVVVDAVGLTVRRPGDSAAMPIPWSTITDVRYVQIQRRGRSNQIEVHQADGTARFLADYQVGSIHQVARAIARFYPGDTTAGHPQFTPVRGWAYLGR